MILYIQCSCGVRFYPKSSTSDERLLAIFQQHIIDEHIDLPEIQVIEDTPLPN